ARPGGVRYRLYPRNDAARERSPDARLPRDHRRGHVRPPSRLAISLVHRQGGAARINAESGETGVVAADLARGKVTAQASRRVFEPGGFQGFQGNKGFLPWKPNSVVTPSPRHPVAPSSS